MRYLYITPEADLQLRDGPPLTLARMQELLGGYLEAVWYSPWISGEPTRLVVMDNEEGLDLGLAPTVRFPRVHSIGGVLRGPVLIMALDQEGDQADLSDALAARVVL